MPANLLVLPLLQVLGDHELEPMSKSLLAAPHSMCELRSLLCKTVITCSDILLKPLPRVQTVLYTIACGLIFYYHARMVRWWLIDIQQPELLKALHAFHACGA